MDAERRLAVLLFHHFLDISAHDVLLFADGDDVLGFDRFVAGAAFGIEKAQQLLQRFRIRRVPQEGPFAAHLHQSSFFSLSRWCDSVELGMSSSSPISPTTRPSGCADSSNCIMRRRGSVPIAESMSA